MAKSQYLWVLKYPDVSGRAPHPHKADAQRLLEKLRDWDYLRHRV
jgi:hypothetical protein